MYNTGAHAARRATSPPTNQPSWEGGGRRAQNCPSKSRQTEVDEAGVVVGWVGGVEAGELVEYV